MTVPSINVSVNLSEFKKTGDDLRKATIKIIERLCETAKENAINDYRKRRKTKASYSMIIESFTIESPKSMGGEIVGVVYAETPYLIWVNYGHKLRNNVWWEGYHFMESGANKAIALSQNIIDEELKKV